MIDTRSLIYSLDENISIWDLKNWNFDPKKYVTDELSQRMIQQQISSQVLWDWAHFKFSHIRSAPFIIYSQGDISLLDKDIIAIVWPRKASEYQKRVLQDLMHVIRNYDLVTISWWALGIDMICHQLSIEYQIPTIMVLGWWFDTYLRSRSRSMMSGIVDSWWCIISEFRIWQARNKWTYPQRNRIIAGLSNCTFLPWAAIGSGSLITVDFARQMHKSIYTVPANIYDESSKWSNSYLNQNKMTAVTEFESFLDLHFTKKNRTESIQDFQLNKKQESILEIIAQKESISTNDLAMLSKLDCSDVLWITTELELHGLITEYGAGGWIAK